MKKNTLIFLLSLLSWALFAQEGNNGNVGIGTTTPDSSALLDLHSSNKGLLVPHVELEAIDNGTTPINGPANGLLVYHTGGHNIEMGFYYWNGNEWVGLCSCPAARFGVEITPSNVSVCQGSGDVTLTANATGGTGNYSYRWDNNEMTASINVTPSASTTYTVTVTDQSNNQTATASATVTVNPNPEVTITQPPDAGCPPITIPIQITANVSGDPEHNYDYAWHASTGGNSSGRTISVTPSVSTTYTVTVTDQNGCSVIDSTTVNVRTPLISATVFTVGTGENAVTFKMIPVVPSEQQETFLMGSQKTNSNNPNFDADAYDNEAPVHEVTLTEYAIGETEVTQALWEAVMGTSWPGTAPSSTYGQGANYPAYYVSWDDICGSGGFLEKLNQALESELCGTTFVLPTEAQWEYAAAGGRAGYNPTNHSRIHKYSGSDNIDDVAWYYNNTYNSSPISYSTQLVKGKAHNELGLYDMSGNVREWCSDYWSANYNSWTGGVTDPENTTSGSNRVRRGGSWDNVAVFSRVAYRISSNPSYRNNYIGFRLALVQNRPSN